MRSGTAKAHNTRPVEVSRVLSWWHMTKSDWVSESKAEYEDSTMSEVVVLMKRRCCSGQAHATSLKAVFLVVAV